MSFLSKTAMFFLLFVVVITAGTFRFMEGIIRMISSHPKKVLGTEPIGARSIVRLWAQTMIWITTQIRGFLGLYVQKYHPHFFQRWKKLFRPQRQQRVNY